MYEKFTPGRNIWKKVSRYFFFTMERITIVGIMFGITYIMIKQIFPYNIGMYGLILIINNVLLTIFFILPSPSNPNGLMYQEIVRGLFKLNKPATAYIYSVTKNKKEDM